MKILHVVSVSGGKDSTAVLELALASRSRERVIPIFCDTGNEHEAVYEYLDYLEKMSAVRIRRLKADFSEQIAAKRMFIARDRRTGRRNGRKVRWTNRAKRRALEVLHPTGNPFLDLCLWKGRFPSRKAQFCTEELKRNIAVSFQLDLVDQGYGVISWQGIRRDESMARRNAKKMERIGPNLWAFRPIVDWTALDVFGYCTRRGLDHNPLYRQGMKRVGCMPCINVGKEELREIAARFPEHIDRIEQWEQLVSQASKRQQSTFFSAGKDPMIDIADVRMVVKWAATGRGGRQLDLLDGLADTTACASAYGLCE